MRFHQLYIAFQKIRNKTFNYRDTVKNINTNDIRTYGTSIISCNCTNSKYLSHHHMRIITRALRTIENKKLCKIISEGSRN